MSRPFDLAAARAGEPIEYKNGHFRHKAHFVGMSSGRLPVIQRDDGNLGMSVPFACPTEDLRMAPKKVTVRYRVALCQGAHSQYVMAVQDGDPEPQLRACGFIDWLDEWKSVEVPQGGE